MRFIRLITLGIFFLINFYPLVGMILREGCTHFAQTARDNEHNLYIASLSVGSGECHIVRRHNTSVIIDAGFRCTWLRENDLFERICEMTEKSIEAVYCTHEHDDHSSLLYRLLITNMINYKRIFFGGKKNNYPINNLSPELLNSLPELSRQLNQNSLDASKRYYGGHSSFTINCHRIDGINGCGNTNAHGSIIRLSFANRAFVFLGDINSHTLDALETGGCLHSKISPNRDSILRDLVDADILTILHHASLAHGEEKFYNLLRDHLKARIFIGSVSPCNTKSSNCPRITEAILSVVREASSINVFDHIIKYDMVPIENRANVITSIPIFSTYDAPNGFVLTRITPDGNVSILDRERIFQQVLPPNV